MIGIQLNLTFSMVNLSVVLPLTLFVLLSVDIVLLPSREYQSFDRDRKKAAAAFSEL